MEGPADQNMVYITEEMEEYDPTVKDIFITIKSGDY